MPIEDLMHGVEELDEARPDYRKAAMYYRGDVPEVFASTRLRRALEDTGIEYRHNFAKTAVNAVVDRLELAAITSPQQDQNEAIAELWARNGMDLTAPDVHRRGCEFGDAYLIALPAHDNTGAVTGIDLFYNSAQTVRIIYSDDNPREKAFAIKLWCERTPLGIVNRCELYYDEHVERWTTLPGAKGKEQADWAPWPVAPDEDEPDDPDSWSYEHDYGEIPVFHFRTDQPYGCPEHYDAYGPQNAINKLSITHMGTVDYQGFPQRYALTEAATSDTSDLEPGDFDDWPLEDDSAGPTDTGDDSALKAGPGEMWLLRGFKNVGQFDPAKPEVFLDPIMFEVRAMAQLTTTPLHLFDPQGEAPSGESVRAKEAPFVKKVRNRQLSFGATWREVFTFALRLLGFADPVVDVRWAPAATVEDQTGWQTVGEKIKNGVPRKQALMEAGYREEQVDEWLSGVDDAELGRRVDILAQLADAAQKLGAAAALGVIQQEQAAALLDGALSDVELLAAVGAEADGG